MTKGGADVFHHDRVKFVRFVSNLESFDTSQSPQSHVVRRWMGECFDENKPTTMGYCTEFTRD